MEIISDYKNLVERQQNFHLKEQEERVKLKELKKTLDILYNNANKNWDEAEKAKRKLENINIKLMIKLQNNRIKLEKSDTDDTPWRKWKKKNNYF